MNEYNIRLGKLVSNLQSLEFILRAFLQQLPDSRPFGVPKGEDIYQYPIGSELPLNEITSWDSLGELINKHNKFAVSQGEQEIDRSIVELRDALAHGRVSSLSPNDSMHLIKFSKPNNNKVRIEYNEILSLDYLNQQIHRVYNAIMIVKEKLKS